MKRISESRRADEPDDEHARDGGKNGRHDAAGEMRHDQDVLSDMKNGLVKLDTHGCMCL